MGTLHRDAASEQPFQERLAQRPRSQAIQRVCRDGLKITSRTAHRYLSVSRNVALLDLFNTTTISSAVNSCQRYLPDNRGSRMKKVTFGNVVHIPDYVWEDEEEGSLDAADLFDEEEGSITLEEIAEARE